MNRVCSQLYNLIPEGLGTMDCESLSGYIKRLSEAHVIPYIDMVLYILKFTKTTRSKFFTFTNIKTINGTGIYASSFSTALNTLTSNTQLQCTTFLPWGAVIAPPVINSKKLWCPRCYYEQERIIGYKYEKLIWSTINIEFCLKHMCSLESKCPQCKSFQDTFPKYGKIGHCQNCHTNLSLKSPHIQTICSEDKWYHSIISMMIADQSCLTPKIPNRQVLLTSLHKITSIVPANTISRMLGFSERTISQWRRNRYSPKFTYLAKLMYALNYDPIAFLCTGIEEHPEYLIKDVPSAVQTSSKKSKYDHSSISAYLNGLVDSKRSDISKKMIAKKLGVSLGYLNYKFPRLIKLISKRHRAYLKLLARKNARKRGAKIRIAVNKLTSEGTYPSTRKVFNRRFGLSPADQRKVECYESWRRELQKKGFRKAGY